jgi:RimJ/RimL family protein N-acetyltransferase
MVPLTRTSARLASVFPVRYGLLTIHARADRPGQVASRRRHSQLICATNTQRPPVTHSSKTSLQPFNPDLHAGILARWLSAPHLVRWWGDPEGVLPPPPAAGGEAIIMVGDAPVGFVRWERPTRAQLTAAGLPDVPEGSIDIDIAIGERGWLGAGVGPEALRQLVKRLRRENPKAAMIMMAPSLYNHGAERACEKAGFAFARRFDDPERGPMLLMVWQGDPAAR